MMPAVRVLAPAVRHLRREWNENWLEPSSTMKVHDNMHTPRSEQLSHVPVQPSASLKPTTCITGVIK